MEHAAKAVAKQGLPRRTFNNVIKKGDKRTALICCCTKVTKCKKRLTFEGQRNFLKFSEKVNACACMPHNLYFTECDSGL